MKLKDECILAVGLSPLALSPIFAYIALQYLCFSISSFLNELFSGLSVVLIFFYLMGVSNVRRNSR
jgi:hypothetical protein